VIEETRRYLPLDYSRKSKGLDLLGRTEPVANGLGGITPGDTIAVAVKLAAEYVGLDENGHLCDCAEWMFGSECQSDLTGI